MNDHDDVSDPPAPVAQMALFSLPDGVMLEIHVPGATAVRGGPSAARQGGFILRRGREIVDVGPLRRMFGRK